MILSSSRGGTYSYAILVLRWPSTPNSPLPPLLMRAEVQDTSLVFLGVFLHFYIVYLTVDDVPSLLKHAFLDSDIGSKRLCLDAQFVQLCLVNLYNIAGDVETDE